MPLPLPRIANANLGPVEMSGGRDADGHRTWKLSYEVRVAEDTDRPPYRYGPAAALQCPGLPVECSLWLFSGMPSEQDIWAWCRSNNDVQASPDQKRGPKKLYMVTFEFSTKPPGRDRGDRQQPENQNPRKEDPLSEKDKISGGFIRYTEEASLDRFGVPIVSTSFEQFRGPQVEFDKSRPQIRVEQNVLDLQLPQMAEAVDHLNDRTLWGFPKRCIKMTVPNWERKFHGNGLIYFTRTLEFDISTYVDPVTGETKSGFDRELLDEGTKAISGHYDSTGNYVVDNINGSAPSPGNPDHYIRFKDRNGENARVIFDNTGTGLPLDEVLAGQVTAVTAGSPVVITSAAHGLINGDIVVVRDLSGADKDKINDTQWTVSGVTGSTFNLATSSASGLSIDAKSRTRWFKISSAAGKVKVQKYDEYNFLVFGIPTGY